MRHVFFALHSCLGILTFEVAALASVVLCSGALSCLTLCHGLGCRPPGIVFLIRSASDCPPVMTAWPLCTCIACLPSGLLPFLEAPPDPELLFVFTALSLAGERGDRVAGWGWGLDLQMVNTLRPAVKTVHGVMRCLTWRGSCTDKDGFWWASAQQGI